MRILVLANHDAGLYKFRKELIDVLTEENDVYISAPQGDYSKKLSEQGCKLVDARIDRHGMNPVTDLKLFLHYRKLIREIRPDVALTYTIKPNIYGGMAAALYRIPYIMNITGMGAALENPGLLQRLVLLLYKLSAKKASCVFFQNSANRRFFHERKLLYGNDRLIPGSGVNLERFVYEEYPGGGETELLYIGRFLKDKGIYELLHAAEKVKERRDDVRFTLIGFADEPNIQAQIDSFVEKGVVRCIPFQEDIRPWLAKCHAVILPSYHEGMSNVLLEAAATGRPVLASDVPGCREAFADGETGIAVKPRDADDLADKIMKFLDMPCTERAGMGHAARKKMERKFDRQIVVDAYLDEIRKVIGDKSGDG